MKGPGTFACASLLLAGAALGADWQARGPGPAQNGQVEGMSSQQNPVAGAIHTVLAHPTDSNILYAGAVNGGIWKTTNAGGGNPTWTPLTDFHESLSIGAMAFDPTDASRSTIVAGIGRYSSLSRRGGARTGLLRTIDGGSSWSVIDGGLAGKNISGVAARGNTIIAAVNVADSFTFANIGIFRSTDGGATFTRISSGDPNSLGTNGLPGGRAWDLVEDPANSSVLYTAIRDAGANNGVYKSGNAGATWTRVSDATMQAQNTDSGSSSTVNIEMAVGNSGEVYAAFMGNQGRLTGIFRSGDGGTSWVQLDTPVTNENGTIIGLQPREKDYDVAGGQGAIHFSIVADPTNANIVYVGGDRQPGPGEAPGAWPNSIGASNYTGRLFRIDASLPAGQQAIALTHNPSTLSNSSPHADSREMTFDAAGNIIQVDDGGIYKRTNPQGTGNWFSLNNNIQVAEIHSLDYDRNTNTITAGTQDIGTVEERIGQGTVWRTVNQGDGGQVAIDDRVDGQSVRYTSSQFLGGFRRRVIDSSGNTVSQTFPSLLVGGQPLSTVDSSVQFYGPVAVNRINGNLLIGTNSVYESTDGGSNLTSLGNLGRSIASIEAGGMSGGVANPDVLYVAARSGGALPEAVLRRTTSGGALLELSAYAAMTGSTSPVDLVMDDQEWANLFVADPNQVFASFNAGDSFIDITGDLTDNNLHTLEFVSVRFDTDGDLELEFDFGILLAGGDDGVFWSRDDDGFGTWLELGAGSLPNAPVLDLIYDPYDDILVAGLQGRGAWAFEGFAASFVPEPGGLVLVVGAGLLALRRRSLRA